MESQNVKERALELALALATLNGGGTSASSLIAYAKKIEEYLSAE